MTVAEGSLVRVAYIPEVTINTIPATPAWQTTRYEKSDLGVSKQTDIPNEVDPSGNVQSITDVGRSITGSLDTLLSFGTYDKFFESLLRGNWASNVLVNNILPITVAFEETYEQGAVDAYMRYTGCRINTLDLGLDVKKSVTAKWGVMGITQPTPTTAILSGATYVAPTTSEVFNAALNLSGLTISGITNSPVMTSFNMKLNSNVYANDIIGQYSPYSHGIGRLEASGSISTLFENMDAYLAALAHTTVGLAFTLTDAAAKSYLFELPKVKLMDGKPSKPGNGQPVKVDLPWQAFKDATIGGSIRITRTP